MNRSIGIRLILAALLALGPATVVAACGSSSGSDKLALVAYSTPQEVYEQVIPDFQKTTDGKGSSFTQSYGASGDQARAVEAGQAADVVALSLAPDVNKLVKANKVPSELAGRSPSTTASSATRSWCSR